MSQLGQNGNTINWQEVLAAFKGDRQLLEQIIDAFQEDCPRLLSEASHAIDHADADAVRRAGHTIKGSLRYFGDTEAYRLSVKLEELGKNNELDSAEKVFAKLEQAIGQVIEELAGFVNGD